MSVKLPPGLVAYFRIVIKAVRQSATHRKLSDQATALHRAIRDLERTIAGAARALERLVEDAHDWMDLPQADWRRWTTDWKSEGAAVIADAEQYLREYAAQESDILDRARKLSEEFKDLRDRRRKSPFQKGLEAVMRVDFDFLAVPSLLVENTRQNNRRLRRAVRTLKPGI